MISVEYLVLTEAMNFPLGISCSKEMVVDQTRQGKLSLTLSGIEPISPPDFHHNYPQLAPIWPHS